MPISPMDEYLVHQTTDTFDYVFTSDRNFYDRYYYNCHPSSGELFLVAGLGQYPNLGVTDAFVSISHGTHQYTVRASRELGNDRLDTSVGPLSVEVVTGLRSLRVRCAPNEWGVAFDLLFEGSVPALEEPKSFNRTRARITQDVSRYAQVGTWSGDLEVAGQRYEVDAKTWKGARDHSWGVRPVGEPEAPVHHNAERRIWSVTRFDDVMHVLKTPEIFSSRAMFTMIMAGGREKMPPLTPGVIRFLWKIITKVRLNPLEFFTARNLIAEDGERHSSMRAVVNRGFTPRQIAAWEPRVRELVDQCVAPLRRGEPFDVVGDLAIPVPVSIIAEMLGIPSEQYRDFKRWSDHVIRMTTGQERDQLRFERKNVDPILEFMTTMRKLAQDRRAHPRDDLISTIVAQQEGDAALTNREVVQFVLLLLVAGNETTTNLIGNLANALLEHPDQLRTVAADPSRIPDLVEEGLRYDSPVQVVFRTVTQDTEIRGVRIPKDEYVAVFLGSANRDERRFPDPDRLDLGRDLSGFPGFGFGKHFCLGASLARLEARVAFEALVPELLRLERAERTLARIDSFLIRGPKRLALQRAA